MTYEKNGLYIDEAHLESFAENYARSLRVVGTGSPRRLARSLGRSLRELRRRTSELGERWSGSPSMPGAVRWLLDNEYLARREGGGALEELARAGRLRRTEEGLLLSRLCAALVRSGLGELTEARVGLFLRGFQRALYLEREELALLPGGLRLALAERLTELYAGPEGESPEAETEAQRLFSALRWLSTEDLGPLLEAADAVDAILRRDPAGVYPRMAEESRARYRRELAKLARERRISEHAAAERVLELAREGTGLETHVGCWILERPLGAPVRRRTGAWYMAGNLLLTLFFSLLPALALGSGSLFFLLLIPVSELVKRLLDFAALRLTEPAPLPRLALENGVPPEGKTLCVLSALLTDSGSGPRLARRLEACYHLSRDGGRENLSCALLADLPDSDDESWPEQEAILAAGAQAVERLNQRYGGGFYLLTRPRRKSREGRWRGWERKRGALLETMRYLRGRESSITVAAGDPAGLAETKYLLALDSDTRLSPGAAKKLIGAMLHPLNHPVVDKTRRIVVRGYGILAPRVGTELSAAGATDFARVFAGQGGTDPYGGECSDLSMDLWRRGGFYGKGILDIDAYLECMEGRVPEDRMLSHDSVEGAFLRSGFAGDTECTDGFPGRVLPYYRRLERWTRGDWQNLPWLFRPGRGLPEIEKWKLFDGLRRSLVAPAALAALLLGFFLPEPGPALSAAVALLTLLSELLLTLAEGAFQADGSSRRAGFHAALFVGAGGGLVRCLLRLLLLPGEAWVCLSAACRALWRLGVSKKRLLEWQTADQSEAVKSGLLRHYLYLWPAPAAGLALLLLAPSVLGKAAGALWMLSPLCALLLSLPAHPPEGLPPEERDYLLGCARDTWTYFDRFLGPEDHWLPPDNFQAQPPVGLARRTSPTNIGLGLLSLLAAADLGFLSPERAAERISRCLDTLEALPKWQGHLFNWYDTETLEPLAPRYVSTVDSGNLCACLIALEGGLREYGKPEPADRARALSAAMGFAPLFDPRRKLFHIGFDIEKGELTSSWYDLLSSEARLTGYLAAARGDVPPVHWRALSRALGASGPYRGMVSWTGTMFEYLMPELLLPLERESLLGESARFCLYVQRRRVRGTDRPWGISESAYAAVDSAMSYRYKAHGCAGLALRRGMDAECVISPYSSFLALPVNPRLAVGNLLRLEGLGARRDFGFWEAVDFTPSRLTGKGPAMVRCVMAHHQGMSLVACDNALKENIMVRRFLSDPAMGAFVGLLEEKLPVGAPLLRRGAAPEPPKTPLRITEDWGAGGTGTDFRHPRCCLLASRTYSLLAAETGLTRALWGAVSPYVSPRSSLDGERGVDLSLELPDGKSFPLLPGPGEARYGWRFTTERAAFTAEAGALRAKTEILLSNGEIGEKRVIHVTNTGTAPASALLRLRLRPLLARREDYEGHPAFYGLGLSARVKNGCLLLRRLPRGGGRELWMCLAPDADCGFDLDPKARSGRAGGSIPATGEEYFLTDPLVTASCALELAPGQTKTVSFALAMAYGAPEAAESAAAILGETEGADLPRTAAAVLGLGREEVGSAFALLPFLCFPTAPEGPVRREQLWRFGVSGDLPVVCAAFDRDEDLPWARKLMDQHLFLCGCGRDFDLVFLSRDGTGYQKPLQSALTGALWRSGGELLRDRKGGVHILDREADTKAVERFAALRLTAGTLPSSPERDTDWRPLPLGDFGKVLREPPRFVWGPNGEFQFTLRGALPPRAWQNLLTNGRMGYLATDGGTGNLWFLNAREYQLSPWRCEPHAPFGPERLLLEKDGKLYSLFASPGRECRITYLPGAALWETEAGGAKLRLTAFIPPDRDARILLLTASNLPAGAALHWSVDLRLGSGYASDRLCRCAWGGGFLGAENPDAMAAAKPFLAMATGGITRYTFRRASALTFCYDEAPPEGEAVFAARLDLSENMVLACGCCAPEELRPLLAPAAAEAALEGTLRFWRERTGRFSLQSPERSLDRLMNGWLPYQILACRLLGRCSVYQSGGAYGFRDQLQDAVNLLLLDSAPARAQILRCCARQYAEGDVQHWWHEGDGLPRGVRTRCSDDLLWLPWALCEYVEKTGDYGLCGEAAPYLLSPPLGTGEADRYEAAPASEAADSVLNHCRRAIRQVMARGVGPTGLLPMGGGDWNDGFDKVRGESVWLSWFFLWTADRFAALLEDLGEEASGLREFSEALSAACDRAWDGEWYLRGRYADGRPLGGRDNPECRIDSIAQSFAVLSGRGDPAKANAALDSAFRLLYDGENELVRLFTPPFAGREHPGYLETYGPGFRENGGQYTHGAVWLLMALLRLGKEDQALSILRALLPGDKDPAVYQAEPFVLSADVYAAPGHEGEAGWSWYTGAAGWLFRAVTEELLGLRLRGGKLFPEPRLPASWRGCRLTLGGLRLELRPGETLVNGAPWDGRGLDF